MSVFLSYAQANREEADRIDRALRRERLEVVRDIQGAGYHADLAGFSERTRGCSAVIVLLSDAYLKSRRSLSEILRLIEARDFSGGIIPVVLEDARIFTSEERNDYVTYWNERYAALREKAEGQSAESAAEWELYREIKNQINTLMTRLGQGNLLSFSILAADGFREVLAAVAGQGNPDARQAGIRPPPEVVRLPDVSSTSQTWGKILVAAGVIIGLVAGVFRLAGYEFRDLFTGDLPGSVTVLVHGPGGRDELVLPERGIVKLVYGDASVSKQINAEGEATFKQIPALFFHEEVQVFFYDPGGEPYRIAEPDRRYKLKRGEYLALAVELEGAKESYPF